MERRAIAALFVLVLIVVVVVVDIVFLQHRFWERLLVNIGIVLAFGALYMGLRRRH
jgi:hypothetical protein